MIISSYEDFRVSIYVWRVKVMFQRIRRRLLNYFMEVFRFFGIGLTTHKNLENLKANFSFHRDLELLLNLPSSHAERLILLLRKSRSQFRQDLFVLSHLQFKENGYFVEFGATNGIDLSNSYLLETEFSWRGILVEPAKSWHKSLRKNRPLAEIEEMCVWSDSNHRLNFNESDFAELSTINSFSNVDIHARRRSIGSKYTVTSISLNDLLRKYNSPKHIDYLSIDTEGSEFEILNALDFNEFSFGVITVEHNFSDSRDNLYGLLTHNGYKRVFEEISGVDDWYVGYQKL